MKPKRTGISSDDCICLLILALAGVLWWTNSIGDFALGTVNVWSLSFGFAPMVVCWILYGYIRRRKKPHVWVTASIVVATLAIYPLVRQSWNPAVVFYDKFLSIEVGMSDEDVLRIMDGRLGGELHEPSARSVPEELRGKGVTHKRTYRTGGSNWQHDSNVAYIFLSDGVVVGTEFSFD